MQLINFLLLGSAVAVQAQDDLLEDITKVQKYFGQVTPYHDNPENHFGVGYVGLPDGCQVESAQKLQRHAQRFPTSGDDDGANNIRFATKLTNFTSLKNGSFTGPLTFLNTYNIQFPDTGLLTGIGASTELASGVQFWNRYGRTIFNATVGQVAYNASYFNGTTRPPIVLRTTSQSRIYNSQINWALGFFGGSFQTAPDPTLSNITSPYEVVVIPEGGIENNTLASYDSCFNDADPIIEYHESNFQFRCPVTGYRPA